MKTWIKRSLIAVTSAAVVLGALAACGSRSHHAHGWSDERITEARGKVVGKISDKLNLKSDQKAKLDVLADELIASRTAFRGAAADPTVDMKALIAGDKFDRTKAQAQLDQKTQVVQGSGPKVISAFADFFDSLTPEQQQQVRERMERRGKGGWGRG